MVNGTDPQTEISKPTAFDYGWRIFWLVSSLFLVVMLPYVIFISMQDQSNLDSKGLLAVGTVSGKECRTMSGNGSRQTCRTNVSFRVPDGRVLSFTDPRPINAKSGQKVNVRYILSGNQLYDAQIVLDGGNTLNLIQWSIIGVMVFVFGGIAAVCSRSLYMMRIGKWKGP